MVAGKKISHSWSLSYFFEFQSCKNVVVLIKDTVCTTAIEARYLFALGFENVKNKRYSAVLKSECLELDSQI